MTISLLKIRGFSYAYPGADGFVLNNIHMDINSGECHCIAGPTGSGKSTLLLAVKNLLPPGKQSGQIHLPVDSTTHSSAGIVFQNPETQLLGTTVADEAAFGLENLCHPASDMKRKIEAAMADVDLDAALDFPVSRLSMGQKYRLVLASVLAMGPALVLLDEPGAQLDAKGIEKLKSVIFRLKNKGVGFLMCEHRPDLFLDVVDSHWRLTEAGELERSDCQPDQIAYPTTYPKVFFGDSQKNRNKTILEAEGLSVGFETPVLSLPHLFACPGQRIGIYGDNGTGKTTLLRCMLGFLPPLEGRISVFGNAPVPNKLRGLVGCLFQNPQKQLFENMVFDEVGFSLVRGGMPKPEIASRVNALLARMGIEHLAPRSPHKLSFGQKHLVVLASALAFEPRLMILDDPFSGLDHLWRQRILSVMTDMSEKHQTAWIWTGHLADEFLDWADLVLNVKGGKCAAHA
jgi:energy-coupling factor transport system ATP-binding protein